MHTVKMGEVDDAARKAELNNQLKEYIAEWRKTREAEEEELAKLKEKQAKRKEVRMEQEKKLNAAKREEEEKGSPWDTRTRIPRTHVYRKLKVLSFPYHAR